MKKNSSEENIKSNKIYYIVGIVIVLIIWANSPEQNYGVSNVANNASPASQNTPLITEENVKNQNNDVDQQTIFENNMKCQEAKDNIAWKMVEVVYYSKDANDCVVIYRESFNGPYHQSLLTSMPKPYEIVRGVFNEYVGD